VKFNAGKFFPDASLYDWIVYQQGSKAREKKEKE